METVPSQYKFDGYSAISLPTSVLHHNKSSSSSAPISTSFLLPYRERDGPAVLPDAAAALAPAAGDAALLAVHGAAAGLHVRAGDLPARQLQQVPAAQQGERHHRLYRCVGNLS